MKVIDLVLVEKCRSPEEDQGPLIWRGRMENDLPLWEKSLWKKERVLNKNSRRPESQSSSEPSICEGQVSVDLPLREIATAEKARFES
jgi:hypothetical protein